MLPNFFSNRDYKRKFIKNKESIFFASDEKAKIFYELA
jgi:hypothetical protein